MSLEENREEIPPPPIPKGCKPLSHQVAGHVYRKCKTRAGLLQDNSGSILKILQTNNRGNREKKFYKKVFDEEHDDPILREARNLLCPFRGTVVSTEDPSVEFIKLRDMTIGYKHPCIMDIKIGRIGYAEEGGDTKKAEMAKLKYPDMEKLGFQILGMRVYHPQSQRYAIYDKKYGKTLNINSMIEGLAKFFNVDENIRTDVMYAFLVRLQQILDWFQVQTKYHFYSSSLLFIYEGALPPNDDTLKKPANPSQHSTMPTRPINGHADEVFPVKPDTYTLKRKKSVDDDDHDDVDDDDNDGASGIIRGNKNQRENGVRRAAEGSDSRVDVSSSHLIAGDVLGTELMNNMVMGRHEHEREIVVNRVQGIAAGTEPSPSQKQRHSHSFVEGTVVEDNHPANDNNHLHFPTPNHSMHEPDISACTNHNGDHRNMRETSHKDSCPPHEGAVDHTPHPVEIRMIDFAHAIEATTRDENYIFGLKMLRQYIETLHNCYVL